MHVLLHLLTSAVQLKPTPHSSSAPGRGQKTTAKGKKSEREREGENSRLLDNLGLSNDDGTDGANLNVDITAEDDRSAPNCRQGQGATHTLPSRSARGRGSAVRMGAGAARQGATSSATARKMKLRMKASEFVDVESGRFRGRKECLRGELPEQEIWKSGEGESWRSSRVDDAQEQATMHSGSNPALAFALVLPTSAALLRGERGGAGVPKGGRKPIAM